LEPSGPVLGCACQGGNQRPHIPRGHQLAAVARDDLGHSTYVAGDNWYSGGGGFYQDHREWLIPQRREGQAPGGSKQLKNV
jgi:hypothetical protein